MREALYPEMFHMEQRHWWFTAKHRIVQSLLRRYLPSPNGAANGSPALRARIADLGCGCGMMLFKLQPSYDVVGADGSEQAIAFCAQRGVDARLGRFPNDIPLEREAFDAVLMLDVLEHLDEDLASARAASALLKPGGVMICTVPAYQWLWSRRDEQHHHKRRYSRSQFGRLFTQSDLRLEMLTYFNTFLFPLAAASRLGRRLLPLKDDQTDLRIPPAPINAALRGVFASERVLMGRLWMPWGLSIAAVARKA